MRQEAERVLVMRGHHCLVLHEMPERRGELAEIEGYL